MQNGFYLYLLHLYNKTSNVGMAHVLDSVWYTSTGWGKSNSLLNRTEDT